MSFVILDTEYTFSWDDPTFDKKEVAQMAAIKVDERTLEVIDSFFCYVKPQIDPVIPQCLLDYADLTQEDVDSKGVKLQDAHTKLIDFCGDDYVYTHGWRDGFKTLADGMIINNNLKMLGEENYPKINYVNIAPWFKKQYLDNGMEVEKQTSGQIADILGKKDDLGFLSSGEHNALYDCYSILVGIKHFNKEGLEEHSKKFIKLYHQKEEVSQSLIDGKNRSL